MEIRTFDVVIVGSGPAGFACAYQLRNYPIDIAIIDKSTFPRDKICGDAISADVVNQFGRMDEGLSRRFKSFSEKLGSGGVRFYSPEGKALDINFKNPSGLDHAGYISERSNFDKFLFDNLQNQGNLVRIYGSVILDIQKTENDIKVILTNETIHAKMIIGADGAHSIVNKKLGQIKVEKNHYCAGLRQYYSGVNGFHPDNHIELHFYKELLPGYFWIFPLPKGKANVGVGMLSSAVMKSKTDLKKAFKKIISEHPNIKDRFKTAKPLEEIKGFGLPIGSKKRPISGDRFLLIGDAASLIDPFTGEGIANAIRSGRIAAEHVIKCFEQDSFNAEFNKNYDRYLYSKIWNELRIGRSLQNLSKYPFLFNFIIRKANKNPSVQKLMTAMLDDIDLKKELSNPIFYLRLLFN